MSLKLIFLASLIVHLDASLKTQVLSGACFELAQGVESFSLIGE
jgi:hypothetical protein